MLIKRLNSSTSTAISAMSTKNRLGIIRHIFFFDDDFKDNHPEVPIEKKSDSPDENKSIGDSTSLKPVLEDYFNLHSNHHYST